MVQSIKEMLMVNIIACFTIPAWLESKGNKHLLFVLLWALSAVDSSWLKKYAMCLQMMKILLKI